MKFAVKNIKNAVSNVLKNTKASELYFYGYGESVIVSAAGKQIVGAVKVSAIESQPKEAFGISGKYIYEMLNATDADEVVIQKNDNLVEVKAGKSRWKLVALSNVPPTYKKVEAPNLVLGFSEIRYKELMARALPFIASEEAVSAFNGLTVMVRENECTIYGATRSCVSEQKFRIAETGADKTVVLWREVAALSLPSDVEWRIGNTTIEVVSGDERYTMPLLSAPAPNFERVFPDTSTAKEIVVSKAAINDAVERVGLCARVVESTPLQITINDQNVRLYASSELVGNAEESVVTLNKTGIDGDTIGVSSRYMEKMVKACSSVKLKITYTGDPLKPIIFENDAVTADNEVRWTGVVAPVRLKN
jgi:DNA polymerase III sliding clamp (beta) subunit (PCNA family)